MNPQRSGLGRRRKPTTRTPRPRRSVAEILQAPTCTVREALDVSGLKRTTFFALLAREAISSGLVHVPGQERGRGVRLVNVASLVAYLDNVTRGDKK